MQIYKKGKRICRKSSTRRRLVAKKTQCSDSFGTQTEAKKQLNIFYRLLAMILRPRFIIFRTSFMDRRRIRCPTLNNDPASIGRIKRLLTRRWNKFSNCPEILASSNGGAMTRTFTMRSFRMRENRESYFSEDLSGCKREGRGGGGIEGERKSGLFDTRGWIRSACASQLLNFNGIVRAEWILIVARMDGCDLKSGRRVDVFLRGRLANKSAPGFYGRSE